MFLTFNYLLKDLGEIFSDMHHLYAIPICQ